jgi:Opacity family porin protein
VHQLNKFTDKSKPMKLTTATGLLTSMLAASLLTATTAQAQEKTNDAGLAIQLGNGTSIGIQGKIGISENFSLRPEIFFGGSGTAVENITYVTPANFRSPSAFTAPTSFVLPALSGPATLAVPLTVPTNFTTTTTIVLSGRTIPAGTVISAGTIIPAGTVVPAGTTIPAGTVLPAGTNVPANTIIPAGVTLPAGTIGSRLTRGTSFGLAATYDFRLDPQGKSTAYIGPKVSFASASGPATINGVDLEGSNLDVRETKIGLVLGTDYAISNDLTIGANLTYNFSRNTNVSGTYGIIDGSVSDFARSTNGGSSLDFGIRAAYRF